MYSDYYTNALKISIIPVAKLLYEEHWILQQDNASVHNSIKTTYVLDVYNPEAISWPTKSPDLNIIKNVWNQLVNEVYKAGRQFQSAVDLQDAIMVAWNNLQHSYIRSSFHSIPWRLISVIPNKSGMIIY